MHTDTDVLVIGAGQAGLSAAYHLQRTGTAHVVVDAETGPGGAWRHRWPTLTMATVNGIAELPASPVPTIGQDVPARDALPGYFGDYETRYALDVRRPVSITRVESRGPVLLATSADGDTIAARGLINATGSWTRPFWPYYPGAAVFAGRQLHTHDYTGPEGFEGARMVLIGGGISAVQMLVELAPHTAAQTWVTRREPVFLERTFTTEFGREAVAMVIDRVARGLPPQSVVSVTGLPLTPVLAAARANGVLRREEMFTAITETGVRWADGRSLAADVLFWCTGFRAALDHLAPLRLRAPGGGIVLDGTAAAIDRRVHLVGYGPSASTIGANRAGRIAVRSLREHLQLREGGRNTSGWSLPKK